MRIEEEIKQRSFKNEFHKLVINIKFTAGWLGGFHTRMLKCHGLSSQQFNVLRILKGQYPKPSSLILIKDRMLDKDSNASRLIDKLESAGLTKRVQCPNDRRQVDITITEAGLQLLDKVNPEVDKLTSEIMNLSQEEASTLNNLLDKLREGIENKNHTDLTTKEESII
jgi:DNA-binding MarR family transcriptional regulator